MNPYFRPRRSMLYVPGCNPRYPDKARILPADSVIFDLGDPILVGAKEASRQYVVEAVRGGDGAREMVVRVAILFAYANDAFRPKPAEVETAREVK